MLNKSAIIANAKKLTSKGQLDKAIAEYQKLLEENHDGNLFNTVGDLQVRKGDEEAAIESYTSAASIYKKDGFYPKATALYKKILNIRPTEVSALIALATLDAERGLKGNAIECYLKAAEIYYREGAKEKVLMTIDRALQLSPSDIETRLRIADVYLKAGTKQRAANEYASVASSCAEKQAYDQARELLKKASELDPENVQTFIGLSRLAALTGDEEAAFQYLVQAMSQDGCDKKCAELFLEMAIQTGNQEIAEKMLGAQLQKNPSNIFISNLLAKMHMEDGNIDAAWVLLAPAIDRELSNDNSEAALEMLEPFAELKSLPVLQRLVTAYRGLDNTEGLKEALYKCADIHEQQGNADRSLIFYRDILAIDPDNQTALQKIADLTPAEEAEPEPVNEPSIPETGDEEEAVPESTITEETPQDIAVPNPEQASVEEQLEEASFFEQQGMKDEALSIYRALISATPNEDIQRRIDDLESATTNQAVSTEETLAPTPDMNVTSESTHSEPAAEIDSDVLYREATELRQEGHLDKAIEKFKLASQSPDKQLLCRRMIASCFTEKGSYPLAIAEYIKILEQLDAGDISNNSIKFELAETYSRYNDYQKALEIFTEIHLADPEFRDVASKLEAVKSQIKAAPAKSKKNRVSYI